MKFGGLFGDGKKFIRILIFVVIILICKINYKNIKTRKLRLRVFIMLSEVIILSPRLFLHQQLLLLLPLLRAPQLLRGYQFRPFLHHRD